MELGKAGPCLRFCPAAAAAAMQARANSAAGAAAQARGGVQGRKYKSAFPVWKGERLESCQIWCLRSKQNSISRHLRTPVYAAIMTDRRPRSARVCCATRSADSRLSSGIGRQEGPLAAQSGLGALSSRACPALGAGRATGWRPRRSNPCKILRWIYSTFFFFFTEPCLRCARTA